MAIYHLRVQTIGRADGRSAVAAAAYRSTSRLTDERTGVICDYTRKEKALMSGIELPPGVPKWAGDRARLWNEVEKKENRKNSILAYEIDTAIPAEIEKQDREMLIKAYCKTLTEKGLVCDWSIHPPAKKGDQRNIHAHILFTTRTFENGVWSKNKLQMNRERYSEFITERRSDWELCANAALKKLHENQKWDIGHKRQEYKNKYGVYPPSEKIPETLKIDRRTLAAQGISREPQRHQGPAATAMERKGKKVDRARTTIGKNAAFEVSADIENEREVKNRYSTEIAVLENRVKLISATPEEFKRLEEEAERELLKDKSKAFAFSSRVCIKDIDNANYLEKKEINKKLMAGEEKKPEIWPPEKNKLKALFLEWTDNAGKKYNRYDEYEKAQKIHLAKWQKFWDYWKAKESGNKNERVLIDSLQKNPVKRLNDFFKLGKAQEKKRPELFEKIKRGAQELLAALSEFARYRTDKAFLDEVREARAETARREEISRRQQPQEMKNQRRGWGR